MKNRLALERARNLDVIIFDKTGTLTRGTPILSGIETAAPSASEDELLALAAAVEADSEHPIAKAIFIPFATNRLIWKSVFMH